MADYLTLLRREIYKFSKGNWVIDHDKLLYYLEELNANAGGGGGGSAISVSDEGSLLTNGVTSFNFVGNNMQATAVGNAVTVSVDNHLTIQVKNDTGSPIAKGSVCYIQTGGSSALTPNILLADATNEANSSKTIGIAHSTIANGNTGLLVVNGELEGTGSEPLNTSAYTIGTKLWLSTTPGQVTDTPPAFPNHTVFIGHVTRSQNNNGRILVEIQNGFEMNELHDTKFTSLFQNDVMMYDSNTGPRPFWYNQKMIVGITSTALLSLQSSNTLVPGVWYSISNKPASIEAVLIQAVSPSYLNPKGIAIILNGGVTPITTDCWYDLSANSPYKIFDPKYNNTVEGWTSIQTFKWNNPNWHDNYISEGGTLGVNNTTNVTNFFNNTIVDGSVLNIQGCSAPEISSNTLLSASTFDLTGSLANLYIKNNSLSTCSFQATSCIFDSILNNSMSSSSYIDAGFASWAGIDNNMISGSSVINLGFCALTTFSNNRISSSVLQFNASTLTIFSNNDVSGSSVTGISTSNNERNTILNSTILLDGSSTINYCSINSMGINVAGELTGGTSGPYIYVGCNYLYNSESNFYAEYDLDDPAVYDPVTSTLTLYPGHQECIGKIILAGSGSPVYQITDVVNYPEHNFITFTSKTTSLIELRTTSGFFKFTAGTPTVDIPNSTTYVKFSGIRKPEGNADPGYLYLIENVQY